MPQLNPAPWFYMLTLSWLILLALKPTLFNLISPHPPHKALPNYNTSTWVWLWQ